MGLEFLHVPIARPSLGPEEREAVLEVLAGAVFTKGPRVAAFEEAFAAYHGARHAIAMSSGTAALTCALAAHGIGPGDEVIVPAFSFFATASSVLAVGATPVFADIDPATFCLSPEDAERRITARTKALMPVHLYGMPADLPRLSTLCEKRGLLLLEDAAQAHGAGIDERRVGSFGTAAFSFFGSKNMTTFEGGMVLTADAEVARRVRSLRNHGRGEQGGHERLGGNFRMTELSAAVGSVQLGKLDAFNRARSENARYYRSALRHALLPVELPGRFHVYHQFTVRARSRGERDAWVSALNERGVEARVYYPRPIYREPVFTRRPEYESVLLPETERASELVLSLPIHPGLAETEREHVASVFNALA